MLLVNKIIHIQNNKYNGLSKISGTTKNAAIGKLIPFAQVKLFDQKRSCFICSTNSDENAIYEFNNLNNDYEYFLVFHDPDKLLNGVIADNIGGGRDMDE